MAPKRKTKSTKQEGGTAEGAEVDPGKDQNKEASEPRIQKSIPIGMPVSKEKLDKLKKKSKKR